ncbi:MAG TPA: hypothetical protein PKA27_17600, partial [Fimbriimonadaceae bacterium]|nr:hypothetical protein [Fimbriimonadaceae bacterium]
LTLTYVAGVATSLVRAIEDWGGRRWTMVYDAQDYLTSIMTPLGCITKYGYSLAGSSSTLLHTIEDPRGYVTSYQYDANRRVVSMVAGTATWNYEYDSTNRRTLETWPTGAVVTYNLDNSGNNVSTHRPEGYVITYEF